MENQTIKLTIETHPEDIIDVDPEIIKKMKIRLSKDFKDFLSIARKLGRENEFLTDEEFFDAMVSEFQEMIADVMINEVSPQGKTL